MLGGLIIPLHIQKNQYFLTFVDNSTRFIWTLLLTHKSDVSQAIPKFINAVNTQFKKKLNCLKDTM